MQPTVKKELLLGYVGLPPSWSESDEDEINTAVSVRLSKAMEKILATDKGGVVFVNGDGGYLIKALEDLEVPMAELKGYDFADYFARKFNSEEQNTEIVAKKFTFLYNVGVEEALKKDYPAQMLKGIMKKVVSQNCWVFVVSEVAKTTFERDYGITITNSLKLPNKKQVELF